MSCHISNLNSFQEVSNSLMQHMAYLSTVKQLAATEAAQQKTIVSYFLPQDRDVTSVNPVLIEEARNLLAIGGNVGFRTWDACLRLAYFLSTEGHDLIQGKNVIELGAGTGLLSILCAGHLDAASVLSTDGVADVVTSIERNIRINQDLFEGSQKRPPGARILNWTDLSELSEVLKQNGQLPKYDIILGSDITYNLDYMVPLVETFDAIDTLFPDIDIIISGAIRNINTFNAFIKACSDKGFEVSDVPFECPSFHQQKGFFHTIALPIRIFKIMRTSPVQE